MCCFSEPPQPCCLDRHHSSVYLQRDIFVASWSLITHLWRTDLFILCWFSTVTETALKAVSKGQEAWCGKRGCPLPLNALHPSWCHCDNRLFDQPTSPPCEPHFLFSSAAPSAASPQQWRDVITVCIKTICFLQTCTNAFTLSFQLSHFCPIAAVSARYMDFSLS